MNRSTRELVILNKLTSKVIDECLAYVRNKHEK